MNDISHWSGIAWHVDSGYQHGRTTTVLDIYTYESEELGNEMPVYGDALELYGHLPARQALWVCANKQDAARYGRPRSFELTGVVICSDGQGGYLVVRT